MKRLLNLKKEKHSTQDYFKQAQSWADDRFGLMQTSRARYQVAFIAAMLANSLLALSIAVLLPLKRVEPLVVHHYDNGVVTIDEAPAAKPIINRAQIESDLVRYVTTRESFEVNSYRAQYDLIVLLSNHAVSLQYQNNQKSSNAHSPINTFGNRIERSVHVYSVNFLDDALSNQKDLKKNHHNLAEVVFDVIDRDKTNGHTTTGAYNALISWRYTAPSDNPAVRWKNWDGFEIASYSIQPRNIKES